MEHVIRWQLQRCYELVLQVLATLVGFIEAERLTEREQEGSQVREFDEGGRVGVELRPDLAEALSLVIIE